MLIIQLQGKGQGEMGGKVSEWKTYVFGGFFRRNNRALLFSLKIRRLTALPDLQAFLFSIFPFGHFFCYNAILYFVQTFAFHFLSQNCLIFYFPHAFPFPFPPFPISSLFLPRSIFPAFFQSLQYSLEKKIMRKRVNILQRGSKQNRYDQYTNLGIDVENHMAKSIILPKIYNKIAEIEASEFIRQRKAKEDREMSQLKEEINRLRKHICLIDERKAIQRMKTEDTDDRSVNERHDRPKQTLHIASNNAHRHSIQASHSRFQRNTDKHSQRQVNNSSFFVHKSQVSLVSSTLRLDSKSEQPVILSKQSLCSLSKIKQKEAKTPSAKLRRKFRVAVFAAFFTVFLPAFSKRVYQNKLKQFMLQYPIEVAKYFKGKLAQQTTFNTLGELTSKFKVQQAKLWNFFEDKTNILEMVERSKLANCLTTGGDVKLIKEHFQFLMNNQLDTSERDSKEQQQTLEQQLMYPKNIEYLMQGFQTLLVRITDTISAFITRSDFFANRWKSFSVGIMNNAFVHNSHPKLPVKVIESGIVRLHPFKEVLLVYNQETQSLLLAVDILSRIFSHRWMVRLEKIKGQSEQNEPVRVVSSFLVSIFHLICEKMLDDHLQTFKKESVEPPASVRVRSKFIRPIVPLLVRGDKKRDEKLLKTTRLIANPPFEDQATEALANNPALVLAVQAKVKNIGYLLYDKLSTKMKDDLKAVKQKTLGERILTQPVHVKNDKGEFQVRGEVSSSLDRTIK